MQASGEYVHIPDPVYRENADMILERDDEGNFRAMDADPFSGKKKNTDPALIRALITEMEKILHH